MISFDITPLAPVYVLLLGAILLLALGPAATTRVRNGAFVAINASALALILWIDKDHLGFWRSALPVTIYPLTEWLDGTTMAFYGVPATPLVGGLFAALLSTALAGHDFHARVTVSSQVLLLVIAAAAYGVLMAGTCPTLASAILAFEGAVALWWLARNEPGRAMARLLLGVITATGVMVAGLENIAARPDAMPSNALLTLAIWLRLGFYPLLESDASVHSLPSVRLAWTIQHLIIGLYSVMWGVAPWIVWPALVTALLHGTLAWVEPERERRLMHAAFASSGILLAAVALGGHGALWTGAPVMIVAAWLVLKMIPSGLTPFPRSVSQMVGYLPPLVATLSLIVLPAIGVSNRESLFELFWNAGGPGVTAFIVITWGGVLSSLYQFWRGALAATYAPVPPSRWRAAGIGMATWMLVLPFLVAWVPPLSISYFVGTWIGMLGSALWAISLGYGRRVMHLLGEEGERHFIMRLRMRWFLQASRQLLGIVGGGLLRVRTVIEGEHYLAWALLLLVCLGLVLAVYPNVLMR